MLSSEPLNLKSIKQCFMSRLISTTNFVDYPDGVTWLQSVISETLQHCKKIFLDLYAL